MTDKNTVTLGSAYRFFMPLILMTELNMISKSVINAFLARTATPSLTLAAFNISFTFYFTLVGITEVTTMLTIGYVHDRAGLKRIVFFLCSVLALPVCVALVVALTSLGDWLYGTVFSVSAGAVVQAKQATLIFCFSAPVLIARGIAFALLMTHHRTLLITVATLIRVASLAVFLTLFPLVFSGAPIGAAALVGCMVIETSFAWAVAWKHVQALEGGSNSPPRLGQLWRFTWPLGLNQTSEMGVVFVVNLFLGRLEKPDLALAAFGVVHGLVSLMFSPMRNLVQTAQTLVGSSRDARVLFIFTMQLSAIFAVIALAIFATPIRTWVLSEVMGLSPALASYCAPAMMVAFTMAVFWALATLCRGLLASARTTIMLALTAVLRIVAVCVVGAATLIWPSLNGAVVGLSAWIFAYAVEMSVLGLRLRMLYGKSG